MKFIGRDKVTLYTDADNFRKVPDASPQWQDSTWLQWWDLDSGCGGVHRIGHEYNIPNGPFVNAWSNLVTPSGCFKRVTYLPLRNADKLDNGWGSGDDTCSNEIIDGEHIWNITDAKSGISARLTFVDYHPPFLGFPSAGRTMEDITSHHIDVSGTVTGTISMQGKTFKINGMGLRDHGWGHRNLGTMLSHRYITTCFGPELSFCAYAIHNGVNDRIESFGWAVKGDTVVFASNIDIIVYAEVDSASTRGGHIVLTLADGDVLDCELTAVAPGMVNVALASETETESVFPSSFSCNDTLCRATCNGKIGTGMVETSMNYHYGKRRGERMLNALIENGFYTGTFDELRKSANNPFVVKGTF